MANRHHFELCNYTTIVIWYHYQEFFAKIIIAVITSNCVALMLVMVREIDCVVW